MGTTTKYALPWPENTARVADGWSAIKALADAVDAAAWKASQRRRARGALAANQMINGNTWTQVALTVVPTEDFTTPAAGRLAVPIAGTYLVTAQAVIGAWSIGYRGLSILKNSAGTHSIAKTEGRVNALAVSQLGPNGGNAGGATDGNDATVLSWSGILELAAADYLEMWCHQSAAGQLPVIGTAAKNETWLAAALLQGA